MPTSALDPARTRYGAWLRRVHGPAHARRTAERNAAFLLRYLQPGMRLLDAGCGQGSITLGLAEAVADGEAVGIDIGADTLPSPAQLGGGAEGEVSTRFLAGDVNALPFADASFDTVFCHAVLQHLRDPLAALREFRRVLRPGGVIGVADADYDGSIIAPADPALDASTRLLEDLRARTTGGDLRIGKHLRRLLQEAGFERVVASVQAGVDGDAESAHRTGLFWANYLGAPELREYAVELGLTTEAGLNAISDAWRRWSESPGALWARFWCQAVAYAPN
jgi:ubiquinone/menaquinone biosynthesis C-methylase UbiE